MNKQQSDILHILLQESFINQRILAEQSGHSLGIVNRSLRELLEEGYIDEDIRPTSKAMAEYRQKAPRNAVILAAGFGMRMVPINMETPKALLEVNGERLIERIIKQLQEVGIREITVVVGFRKEQFEYLIDQYDVELVVNREYAGKNNLHSLKLVLDRLSNTYVIPCDIWCNRNPFHRQEFYSWYMVSDLVDDDSSVRVNRKMELVKVAERDSGNAMIGISYLLEEDAAQVRSRILEMAQDSKWDDAFWEDALYRREGHKEQMIVSARVVHSRDVVEIDTYEQLRDLDCDSDQLKSDAISTIARVLHAAQNEVENISVLKKGMTNRSFLFECRGNKYIMRIPGEGTDQLINRAEEAAVYRAIQNMGICDHILYIDPENGYKITEYLENARPCDPNNVEDLKKCMQRLRAFHTSEQSVEHEFDIFRMIDFYESLWMGQPSAYRDYRSTKEKVLSLRTFIEVHVEKKVLTHIDAVPDNFLFARDDDSQEQLYLIDWEYAGMQDPHVDIAMFCIYAMYNKRQVDRLIQLYFTEGCPDYTRVKIYCYIAACGLLWSNWCEFKRNLGVEFGEYSLRQYRFAKDYYRLAMKEIQEMGLINGL